MFLFTWKIVHARVIPISKYQYFINIYNSLKFLKRCINNFSLLFKAFHNYVLKQKSWCFEEDNIIIIAFWQLLNTGLWAWPSLAYHILTLTYYFRSRKTLNVFLVYLFNDFLMKLHEQKIKNTAQKIKFSIKNFFSKCDQTRRYPADLVTFTEEIINGKLLFLCSGSTSNFQTQKRRVSKNQVLRFYNNCSPIKLK